MFHRMCYHHNHRGLHATDGRKQNTFFSSQKKHDGLLSEPPGGIISSKVVHTHDQNGLLPGTPEASASPCHAIARLGKPSTREKIGRKRTSTKDIIHCVQFCEQYHISRARQAATTLSLCKGEATYCIPFHRAPCGAAGCVVVDGTSSSPSERAIASSVLCQANLKKSRTLNMWKPYIRRPYWFGISMVLSPSLFRFLCSPKVKCHHRRLSISRTAHNSWPLDKPISSVQNYILPFDIMRSSGFLLSAALLIGSAVDVLGGVSPS